MCTTRRHGGLSVAVGAKKWLRRATFVLGCGAALWLASEPALGGAAGKCTRPPCAGGAAPDGRGCCPAVAKAPARPSKKRKSNRRPKRKPDSVVRAKKAEPVVERPWCEGKRGVEIPVTTTARASRCLGTAGKAAVVDWVTILPKGSRETFAMGGTGGDSDELGPGGGAVRVTLTRGYALERTEVTVANYRQCVLVNCCDKPREGEFSTYFRKHHEEHPVNDVSWHDARAYCAWVGGRLPTEAEWEFAARGDGREFAWGKDWPPPHGSGNFADESAKRVFPHLTTIADYDDRHPYTAKAGAFSPGYRGLSDMAGNVWEWVEDAYSDYDGDVCTDPYYRGKGDSYKVVRGGSWLDGTRRNLRAASRSRGDPSGRSVSLGFRCARTL